MAHRRMFSEAVVGTDDFLDLPLSSQALYFHLGIYGDDDSFVSCPRKVARSIGANMDDLQLLVTRGFLIEFQSGVVALADWKRNNTLRSDRYTPSIYAREKEMLAEDDTKKYVLVDSLATNGIPAVSKVEPQHNIIEHNIVKQNKIEGNAAAAPLTLPPPSGIDEVRNFAVEQGLIDDSTQFYNHYAGLGWKTGANQTPIANWQCFYRKWVNNKWSENKSAEPAPAPREIDGREQARRMKELYAVLSGERDT